MPQPSSLHVGISSACAGGRGAAGAVLTRLRLLTEPQAAPCARPKGAPLVSTGQKCPLLPRLPLPWPAPRPAPSATRCDHLCIAAEQAPF